MAAGDTFWLARAVVGTILPRNASSWSREVLMPAYVRREIVPEDQVGIDR